MHIETIPISVDTGMAHTKYCIIKNGQFEADSFATIIEEIQATDENSDGIRIELGGRYYVVGANGVYEQTERDTKLEDKHYLATYTAIAKSLEKLEVLSNQVYRIALSINIPVTEFKNKNIKDQYVQKYLNRQVHLTLNETKAFSFVIAEVTPFFESQGYLLRNLDKYADTVDQIKQVYVVDLGGRSDSHAYFRSLKPQSDYCVTGRRSVISMLENMAMELGGFYTAKDVEDIARGRLTPKPEAFDAVFEKHARHYMQQIKNHLIIKQVNLKMTDLVFTGGGSGLMAKQIHEFFATTAKSLAISNDGQYDNCKGALKRAVNLRSNQATQQVVHQHAPQQPQFVDPQPTVYGEPMAQQPVMAQPQPQQGAYSPEHLTYGQPSYPTPQHNGFPQQPQFAQPVYQQPENPQFGQPIHQEQAVVRQPVHHDPFQQPQPQFEQPSIPYPEVS
ncbi:MAG: hypothetical protein FWF59_04730 [Turicibacter sp.]|nr:hypothetical protein [Turicibacter sp.]